MKQNKWSYYSCNYAFSILFSFLFLCVNLNAEASDLENQKYIARSQEFSRSILQINLRPKSDYTLIDQELEFLFLKDNLNLYTDAKNVLGQMAEMNVDAFKNVSRNVIRPAIRIVNRYGSKEDIGLLNKIKNRITSLTSEEQKAYSHISKALNNAIIELKNIKNPQNLMEFYPIAAAINVSNIEQNNQVSITSSPTSSRPRLQDVLKKQEESESGLSKKLSLTSIINEHTQCY